MGRLGDGHTYVRSAAAEALRRLGGAAEFDVLAALVGRLGDGVAYVRLAAAAALGSSGAAAAGRGARRTDGSAAAGTCHADVRLAAVEALGSLGQRRPRKPWYAGLQSWRVPWGQRELLQTPRFRADAVAAVLPGIVKARRGQKRIGRPRRGARDGNGRQTRVRPFCLPRWRVLELRITREVVRGGFATQGFNANGVVSHSPGCRTRLPWVSSGKNPPLPQRGCVADGPKTRRNTPFHRVGGEETRERPANPRVAEYGNLGYGTKPLRGKSEVRSTNANRRTRVSSA